MRIALPFFVFLAMVGCSKEELPPGQRAGGFKIADAKEHQAVVSEMRNRGIPLKIDERDFVNYMLSDKAEVQGIQRDVQHGPELDPNYFESIPLVSEYVRARYEERFKQENIPYTIEVEGKYYSISYSQTYGPKVDLLSQELDIKIMDYYRESR